MDKYPLYLDGRSVGALTVTDCGMYADYRAVCRTAGSGLLRAYLVGERSEMLLGVLAPEGGAFTIGRRFSRRETENLGRIIRCEARRNGQQAWECASAPEQLLSNPFFSHMLQGLSGVLSRREGERRLIAIPWNPTKPFPMTPLFCFAKICRMEDMGYVVFAFDGKERPLMP